MPTDAPLADARTKPASREERDPRAGAGAAERQRAAIVLTYYEELSMPEAAAGDGDEYQGVRIPAASRPAPV